MTAKGIADAVRCGARSARSVVEAALSRLPEANSHHVFIAVDADAALRRADLMDRLSASERSALPLAGVPITVKDNLALDGFALTGGSPALASHRPRATATAVQRVLDAGAIVIGKTNLHELAFGITGANAYFGNVTNPRDPDALAGGSSSGAAASVALGMVPIAFGTDTGGSIRIPAALTGTIGFRPSTGHWPGDGVLTLSTTRDTVGVIAADMADVALVDSLVSPIAGALAPNDARSLRLALPLTPYGEGLSAPAAAAWEESLERLRRAGHELVGVDASMMAAIDAAIGMPIAVYETAKVWREFCRKELGCDLREFAAQLASADVRNLFLAMADGDVPPDAAYREAMVQRSALQAAYASLFRQSGADAVLLPATRRSGVTLDQADTTDIDGVAIPTFPAFVRQTGPASAGGWPSLALPGAPQADGRPAGLLLETPLGTDHELLWIGQRLSKDLHA